MRAAFGRLGEWDLFFLSTAIVRTLLLQKGMSIIMVPPITVTRAGSL